MTTRAFAFAALLSTCALSACATAPLPPAPVAPVVEPAPPVAAEPVQSEHEKLFALFKASDEAQLKRNPLQGIFRGDLRYADRFGDYITDAYYAGERAAA